jgi:hypothetical protein
MQEGEGFRSNVRRWGEDGAICGMCGSGRAQDTPRESQKMRRSNSIGTQVNVAVALARTKPVYINEGISVSFV